MKLMNKRIILTGAAGGIGQPLALALASQGARLALVERNQQRLDEICQKIADQNFTNPVSENSSGDSVNNQRIACFENSRTTYQAECLQQYGNVNCTGDAWAYAEKITERYKVAVNACSSEYQN